MSEFPRTSTEQTQSAPEYADVTAEKMRKAMITSKFITSRTAHYVNSNRIGYQGNVEKSRKAANIEALLEPGFAAREEKAGIPVAERQANPDVSVDDMNRVNQMLEDAYAEHEQRAA